MTPAQVADVLETSGAAFVDLLKSLPAGLATWRPAPQEWCINEVVGHIVEAEKRGFAGRIRLIVGADEPVFETWDQPAVAAARRDCEKSPSTVLDEFEPLRRESLQLVRSLKDEQLDRGGTHPKVGRLTVRALLHEWVHHEGNHLRQAYANVQAYAWPDMENAQRFTTG